MMGVYKFKEYKDESFLNFVREMINLYKMTQIRFYPHQGKNIFSEFQLTHIAPNWDMGNPRGFMYMWLQHRDIIKVITLEIFSPDKSLKIKMTVDLEKKNFMLEEITGVSSDEVVIVLNRHFTVKNIALLREANDILIASLGAFFFFSYILIFDSENFSGGPKSKIVLWVFISLFAIFGLFYFFKSHYFGWGITDNLTENKEVAVQQKNKSKFNNIVWWKDTFWGVIIIAIIPGLIIAFLVYLFGWN